MLQLVAALLLLPQLLLSPLGEASSHGGAASPSSRPPPPPAATRDELLCSSEDYCDSPTCPNSTVQMMGTLHMMTGSSAGELQLRRSVRAVMSAVEAFGPLSNPSLGGLHLSFQYLCCYNKTEEVGIARALAAVRWEPVEVRFTRVVCAGSEFAALADPVSQGKLFGVVSAMEEAQAAAGYPVHRFRAEQFVSDARAPLPALNHPASPLPASTVSSLACVVDSRL